MKYKIQKILNCLALASSCLLLTLCETETECKQRCKEEGRASCEECDPNCDPPDCPDHPVDNEN